MLKIDFRVRNFLYIPYSSILEQKKTVNLKKFNIDSLFCPSAAQQLLLI